VPSVRETLEGYVAGRVKAERVVEAVAAAYYKKEQGAGSRERLRPLMDVIERAHPGVVDLSGSTEKPGFAVRLAERPFPKEYEPALRAAAEATVVGAQHAAPLRAPRPGIVARLFGAIRRLFSASA
jgi:hypothetical protein